MKPLQMEFTWRDLGQRYITQLEVDLALERERAKELRRDVEFYRGKVERLELAMMAHGNVPQQTAAALATETPARPSPAQRMEIPRKKSFADLKREWNALTQEQQEQIEAAGKWEVNHEGQ